MDTYEKFKKSIAEAQRLACTMRERIAKAEDEQWQIVNHCYNAMIQMEATPDDGRSEDEVDEIYNDYAKALKDHKAFEDWLDEIIEMQETLEQWTERLEC